MAESKKGFWSGLFRTKSNAQGGRLFKEQPRRASEGDVSFRRRSDGPETRGARRRPRRAPLHDIKGKGLAEPNGHAYEASPLSEWPPSGVSSQEELSLAHAMELISRGVPAHKGHKRPIPHRSDQYYALYTTTAGNSSEETDAANQHDSMTQLTTLRIQGSSASKYPWETLEQPSLAFGYGARPGTITLNHWASLSSIIPPAIDLRDPGLKPREVDLILIFERLLELEAGLEDGNGDLMYRNLYKRFLKDPDKIFNPHKALDKQITDLIMVLSSPDWIDFTIPKNQVVTRFIYDTSPSNEEQYLKFFHQLLLSLELELRINAGLHNEWEKEKLLAQIPPKIQWNLALARRWREYVRVGEFGETADKVRLRFKLRKRQAKMLKRFAQMMKWPNLDETLDALKQNEAEGDLLGLSSHTMAFFSGLVLPGSTFPFLLMNSLVDIDPNVATDNLALLTHMHPHCGFQYRKSYTYWSSTCIVGKVLSPTCHEVGGWIGPARPTSDLEASQIARIRSRKPRQRITPEDVSSMSERSDPLGPPAEVFPVSEYKLVTPDVDDYVDTVRVELLGLRSTLPTRQDHGPQWFDASIQFAIDGVSWPLRLNYDVSFINAWPCSSGPHPLFFDYVYTFIKADEVVNMRDWGSPAGFSERSANSTPVGGSKPSKPMADDGGDDERVLVIEAFGVPDNEVLARAWCSHWGLSAVVVDIEKTCMACGIREAYAATLTVVILVEGHQADLDGRD
ncbi:putative VTC domain-containing protein [Seiridium cardinale]|uniref:VTC domain-containing protein n=1 Tax=Seiridium cardinale TaxID=138064 RepID=A0ABR2Y090_9PEZI